jgi:hypothetical protein
MGSWVSLKIYLGGGSKTSPAKGTSCRASYVTGGLMHEADGLTVRLERRPNLGSRMFNLAQIPPGNWENICLSLRLPRLRDMRVCDAGCALPSQMMETNDARKNQRTNLGRLGGQAERRQLSSDAERTNGRRQISNSRSTTFERARAISKTAAFLVLRGFRSFDPFHYISHRVCPFRACIKNQLCSKLT